jgi:hypothetical protein
LTPFKNVSNSKPGANEKSKFLTTLTAKTRFKNSS